MKDIFASLLARFSSNKGGTLIVFRNSLVLGLAHSTPSSVMCSVFSMVWPELSVWAVLLGVAMMSVGISSFMSSAPS